MNTDNTPNYVKTEIRDKMKKSVNLASNQERYQEVLEKCRVINESISRNIDINDVKNVIEEYSNNNKEEIHKLADHIATSMYEQTIDGSVEMNDSDKSNEKIMADGSGQFLDKSDKKLFYVVLSTINGLSLGYNIGAGNRLESATVAVILIATFLMYLRHSDFEVQIRR